MPTYKIPDVYVEEISLFPPSVAEVETAIPAFVGYTLKADKVYPGANDLDLVPTRIGSLLEFETYYGGAPPLNISQIELDNDNNFKKVTMTANYYMYDALRLFYANGGGDCYIVSIKKYGATVTDSDFMSGLDALAKYDEPTIILFPDAVLLTSDKMYGVQQKALDQCNRLMDRVTVMDLYSDDLNGTEFRDNIGVNALKYGMAYTPWLKTSLPKNVKYTDVRGKFVKGGAPVTLPSLTTDVNIISILTQLENAVADITTIKNSTTALLTLGSTSLTQRFEIHVNAYKTTKNAGNFQVITDFLMDIAREIDEWVDTTAPTIKCTQLITDIKNEVTNILKPAYTLLNAYEEELQAEVAGYTPQYDVAPTPDAAEWGNIFTVAQAVLNVISGGNDTARLDSGLPIVSDLFGKISTSYLKLSTAASNYVSTFDKSLYENFKIYSDIINGVINSVMSLPPSGAIAGIYAMVDRTRGVWKAPANVSLSYVIGPSNVFTVSELEKLNIDVNAGKSINAIRAFVGKGTMVWGARTLAGNDNEWRYISVRRFFNMVEESVKKSTYWAVFEPNDANTWVKVKSMIENYLILKWKDGALTGAKPEHAFYVKVGLGQTMTAQDILEGRMNVEIGMAVVRPAEFIILKFSHKMQES